MDQKIDDNIDYTLNEVFMTNYDEIDTSRVFSRNRDLDIDLLFHFDYEIRDGIGVFKPNLIKKLRWNLIIQKRKNKLDGKQKKSDNKIFGFSLNGGLDNFFLTGDQQERLQKKESIEYYKKFELGEACLKCGARVNRWDSYKYNGLMNGICVTCEEEHDKSLSEVIDRVISSLNPGLFRRLGARAL